MPYDETGYDLYLVTRAKAPEPPGRLAVIAMGGLDAYGETVVQHVEEVDRPTLLLAQYEAAIVGLEQAVRRGAQIVELLVDSPVLLAQYLSTETPADPSVAKALIRLRWLARGFNKLVVSANPAPDTPHGVPAHLIDFCRVKRQEQDAAVLAP